MNSVCFGIGTKRILPEIYYSRNVNNSSATFVGLPEQTELGQRRSKVKDHRTVSHIVLALRSPPPVALYVCLSSITSFRVIFQVRNIPSECFYPLITLKRYLGKDHSL